MAAQIEENTPILFHAFILKLANKWDGFVAWQFAL